MIFCTLNKYLKKSNITQTKLAERIGVTRPTLNQLIKNENQSIRYDLIEELCKIFGLHLNELLKYTKRDLSYLYTTIENNEDIGMQTYGEVAAEEIYVSFLYGDIRLIFEGVNAYQLIEFDYEIANRPIILECSLPPYDYKIVMNELDKGNLLNDFIDTFNIREQISDENNLEEEYTQRFRFKILPLEETKGFKDYLNKLSDEDIKRILEERLSQSNKNFEDDK